MGETMYRLCTAYWEEHRVTVEASLPKPGKRIEVLMPYDEDVANLRMGARIELKFLGVVLHCTFMQFVPDTSGKPAGTSFIGPLLSPEPEK
jgi:hypothetical protein